MTQNSYDAHVEESRLNQVAGRLRRYAKDKAFAHNHPDRLQVLKRECVAYKRHIRSSRRSQQKEKVTWRDVGLAGAGL